MGRMFLIATFGAFFTLANAGIGGAGTAIAGAAPSAVTLSA